MDISVIVPSHNEEGNLQRLAERITATLDTPDFDHYLELLLVDDNSTDRTPDICDELAERYPEVRVLHRTRDPGFGSAIKAGLAEARGDVLIPFMGDLSDDPADIPKLVRAIGDGYDVAYGSRFMDGGAIDGYPPLKLFYNRAYNNAIRLLFGIRAKDITNAFTAYRREVIAEIGVDNLDSESFDITAELPLRAHILGFESTEVPVSWRSRDAGVSKLNATQKGPLYGQRLFQMFTVGNITGLKDLLGTVAAGSPVRILGAIVIGIAILVGLFSLSGSADVFSVLARANVAWLGVGALVYFMSFAFRTWRYRVLLRTAGHIASRGGVFRSIMSGWFVNFILPARAGDAARGLTLKATEGVPFGVASGLVVIERILDMLVLGGTMVLIAMAFLPLHRANLLAVGALGIATILIFGIAVIYYLDEHVARLLESRFPDIREATRKLNEALRRTVRNPYGLALSLLLTIPIWTLEASTVYFSARAVGLRLLPVETVTTAIAAFLAQAVPVTPAGIGTYEATIAGVLSMFGYSAGPATALGLADHFTRLALVYLLGAISTIHLGFRSRTYFRRQDFDKSSDTVSAVADDGR